MNSDTGEITSEMKKIYGPDGKAFKNMIPLTNEDAERLEPLPPKERLKFADELRASWRKRALEKTK